MSTEIPGRRVISTKANPHTVCIDPRTAAAEAAQEHAEWSRRFEERALLQGYSAVIDGDVIEPGTPEAATAIARVKATRGAYAGP